MKEHIIYTDGACSGNPGKGGWAFAFIEEKQVIYSESGLSSLTTNNKMELTAIISALTYLLKIKGEDSTAVIHTDSSYCMDSLTKWVHNWKKNNWKKSNGKEIENPELIQTLYGLCYDSALTVKWVKVKAHQKKSSKFYDPFNDFVDQLATKEL